MDSAHRNDFVHVVTLLLNDRFEVAPPAVAVIRLSMRSDLLLKLLLFGLLSILAGCDSGPQEESPEVLESRETTKREALSEPKPSVREFDASLANGAERKLAKVIQQGVNLADQVLPGYDWGGNTHLPLSSVAPEMDELDVMDLLLKFEDHYQIDITMADLAAAVGSENVDESRHHLTLERIARLASPQPSEK